MNLLKWKNVDNTQKISTIVNELLVLSKLSRFFLQDMKETFGQYIRQLRNNKGYNLTKLAAMLDIDSGALSKIETDKKVFDDRLLPKLATIFNLDLQNLKDEYYSETIARVLYEKHYSNEVLVLAQEKVKYIRSKNTKQAKLKFE